MLLVSSAALVLMAQVVVAPTKSPSAPVVQVGIFSYGPDGQPQAAAYETTLASESFQYAAGCEIGGGNRPVPDRATDAWRVSGNIERISEDEAVVRVDWQRVRVGGAPASSPGGSIQLTLHPGDRVPLDSANPEPGAGCGSRTIGFEARFGPRPGWMTVPGRGPLKESPAVTIMRGGGASSGAGSGSGFGARSGGGAARVGPTPSDTTASREFSAELFLVRTDPRTPEKPEFNLQGRILKVQGLSPFDFAPFVIDGPAGPITVHINGSLRVATERGARQLVFTTIRNIRYATGGPNGDSTAISTGANTTRTPLPGPEDVLSFELPPIRVANSTAALPDHYEVRVRIR